VAKTEDSKAPDGYHADGEVEDGEGAGPKKKLPLKIIIIAAVAGVGGGTAAMLLLAPKDAAHADKKADHGKKKGDKEKKGKDGKAEKTVGQITEGPNGVLFYTMPNVVVNMQTADGKPTFLKLKLTMEVPDQDTADLLEPNMPRLQDMFQTFLRELRPEDLQGSQGSYQLRSEIQRRVNMVIAPAKVNAVLIEEMLIN
jgi:flagellar FliL protein